MTRCKINDETVKQIEDLVKNFNNGVEPSKQQVSFWINVACQIGLHSMIQNKVDLGKILNGHDPQEWFNANTNKITQRGIFPEERHLKEVASPSMESPRTERKSKYDPEEYDRIRQQLES